MMIHFLRITGNILKIMELIVLTSELFSRLLFARNHSRTGATSISVMAIHRELARPIRHYLLVHSFHSLPNPQTRVQHQNN